MQEIGERFAHAVAARDGDALLDLLAESVDFKGLTPGRFWEATSAREVVDDVILGQWFEADDSIDDVVRVETDVVADRNRVAYRFEGTNASGAFTVEQQAYYEVADDKITYLRIMCSGFRPRTVPA